ncbi:serotriflin-like [Hemicordylus capensis]|uniref:serotriflin-like n=1 Tax=Hemicordylus capensis TaxID=884348 RepID=UPI00230396EE|nr:serotriflin-like [Hemicordylus capensis]
MKKEILDAHNANRRKVEPTASNMLKMVRCNLLTLLAIVHRITELKGILETWSEEAAKGAETWVRKCTGRRSPQKGRIVDGKYCGEGTLQATYPSTWSEVIETWYSKRSNFQYGIGPVNPKKDIYSYTQLIWYNSHEIGCALAYCPENSYAFFYVCRYCPAGNIQGEVLTPYKAGPPCEDCPNHCEDKLCTNPCRYVDNAWGCKELKKMFSCKEATMVTECQATCECSAELLFEKKQLTTIAALQGNVIRGNPKPYKEGPPCEDCPNNCEDKLCTISLCQYMDTTENCKDLLRLFKCDNQLMYQQCQATCRCGKAII